MVRLFKRLWSPRYDLGTESIVRKLAALVLAAGAAGLWHWSSRLLSQTTTETEHNLEYIFGLTTIYLPDGFLAARLAALVLVTLAGYLSAVFLSPEEGAVALRPEPSAGPGGEPPATFNVVVVQVLRSLLFIGLPLFYLAAVDLAPVWMWESMQTDVPTEWLAGLGAFAATTAMLGISAGLLGSVLLPGWYRLAALPILLCAVAVEVWVLSISGTDIERALLAGVLGNLALAGVLLNILSKRVEDIIEERWHVPDAAGERQAGPRAG